MSRGGRVIGTPTVKQRAYYEALAEALGTSASEAWRAAIAAGVDADPASPAGRLARAGRTLETMSSHDAARFIGWLRERAYQCLRAGPAAARSGYLRRMRGMIS